MVGGLLLRGMLVGVVAGVRRFGFTKVFGDHRVDQAIASTKFRSSFQQFVLWHRVASLGIHVVLWATLGLVSGTMTERAFAQAASERLTARSR